MSAQGEQGPPITDSPMSEEPIRVIQITDCHVTDGPEETIFGMDSWSSLEAVLDHARANDWPPAFVLATGDLAETGSRRAYLRLRTLLGPLGVPVYCIPGNHDRASEMAATLVGGSLSPERVFACGAWRFVLLDSTVAGRHGGHLGEARLADLDATLAAFAERPTLVVLHHHPVPIGSPWMDAMGLDDGPALFQVLERHPQVKAVLWGHVHQPFEETRGGVRLIGSPSTCRQFRPLTEKPEFADAPPAYRRLVLHADGRIETALCWVEAKADA